MLGGRGVGVDDLLVADFVGVGEVFEIVVGQVGGRVVDAADLAFLADLDLRGHRVDRTGGVVDVGDGSGRRNGLQVLVVDAVRHDRGLQLAPVVLGRDVHAGVGEDLADPVGFRLPHPIGVLVEVLTAGVLGLREATEGGAALDGELVRGPHRVVRHGVEVDVGEVDTLLGPVVDVLARQIPVQVHLTEADGVGLVVALLDRRHRVDVGLVRDGGQRPDRGLDGLPEIR